MPNPSGTATLRGPSYIVGPEGEPTGVILDIATWRVIVAELEEREDGVTWREHSEAIEALARGERPPGWRELAEFERELDEAEARGDLPS